jgi:hypothetical protein
MRRLLARTQGRCDHVISIVNKGILLNLVQGKEARKYNIIVPISHQLVTIHHLPALLEHATKQKKRLLIAGGTTGTTGIMHMLSLQ